VARLKGGDPAFSVIEVFLVRSGIGVGHSRVSSASQFRPGIATYRGLSAALLL
jgi:hypothetical protein